jgi:glycine C-acetyltransferase
LLSCSNELKEKLDDNTIFFRKEMYKAGFDILEGSHPIVPIMLYDAEKAVIMAEKMLEKGVYVIAFSFPVVPKGKARIRTQISAAHSKEDLDYVIKSFVEVKKEMAI